MTHSTSRGLIKSVLIVGGAQLVGIVISILRMKVLALLLGTAGVGLLSIYNSLQSTASTAAGLGMASSGVRQIASVKGEEAALSRVRVVLFAAHLVQGLLAMATVWLLRDRLAVWLLGSDVRATEVGLVGVAVLFTLLASSQTALLQGMRRIGDLGRVTVLGALAGTVAGLLAVWLMGEGGLVWFVLVQPLTAVLVVLHFTRQVPPPTSARLTLPAIWNVWRPMAALGVVFMLGGLASTVTLLLVRGRITQELGLEAAGLFAASWGIAMTYVGFLLGAMSADYFPRLTEVIGDPQAATRLMNDQAQLGLALGGPVLLLLIGLAPWLMTLFYSAEFKSAADMLQWQTVGNVFKLASWPLGFALIAAARSRVFLSTQLLWNAIFFTLLWVGLPLFGLEVAGTAFLAAYLFHFGILVLLVRRLHDFRWETLSLRLMRTHATLAFALLALARFVPLVGAGASVLLALATGIVGLRIVAIKVGPKGRLASRIAWIYAAAGSPLEKTNG